MGVGGERYSADSAKCIVFLRKSSLENLKTLD